VEELKRVARGVPWWGWILITIFVVGGIGALVDELGGNSGESGKAEQQRPRESKATAEEPQGPFTDSRIDAACPSPLAVGVPTEMKMRVKNTGEEDWPVTFITFSKGLDHFVVNYARIGVLVGRKADTPFFDTYRFGTGAGLEAGEERTARFDLTPKDAGDFELKFAAWGGKEDERSVPEYQPVSCKDLAINP
jgi:hypothetical protein